MFCGTTVALCLTLAAVCSGLILERLPRHIPIHKSRFAQDSLEDEDLSPSFDSSVEKRKIIQDPNQLAPLIMKPTWKAIYPFSQDGHIFNTHRKRAVAIDVKNDDVETSEKERHELADILKDEDPEEKGSKVSDSKKNNDKKEKTANKHSKTKRQSNEEVEKIPEIDTIADTVEGEQEEPAPNPDFQDWLRREYYRNMAKSFASMRRKRDGSGGHDNAEQPKSRPKREKKSKKNISFEEVTDNLRAIEDVLFLDALQTIREAGDDYDEDPQKQRRITNDLSSAYDLETMRNALFRLRDTLGNMEQETAQDEERFRPVKKRGGDQCPPLELLTSDCSSLGDIVPDGPLKRLLLHACNWHEVCYTCGEVFGLTSENCDVGFIEQSQTICRGDVPCESTASLLLLPLRQRRVFYKRSNPSVCLVDSCVEDFLKQV